MSLSTGLIDSGATAALRQALPGELEHAQRVKVQLAVGEVDMWVSPTLLCEEAVQPILPMARLASLGCVVNWTDKGISICHPKRGKLPVRLSGPCPEVSAELAVQLIQEYESDLTGKEEERVRRISWWEASERESALGSASSAADLFQVLRQDGCAAEAQMRFLRCV